MNKVVDFTQGGILGKLLKFMVPVFLALLIQSLYGSVDLLIVGKFGDSISVAGVATGGQIVYTLTSVVTGLAMGTTVLLGQFIGEGRLKEAGRIVGTSIFFFACVAVVITVLLFVFAGPSLNLLQLPNEAMGEGTIYVKICSIGFIFIMAYNVIGSIFRGIGDSATPLITVAVACVVNIIGDLILVGGFGMKAAGAAIATVAAQAVSVVLSVILVKKKGMPFEFDKSCLKPRGYIIGRILKLGTPLAVQEIVVSGSFLVLSAIFNTLGIVASAGAGVCSKLISFVLLFPTAFLQALSAFIAQNIGARKLQRAKKAMGHAMWVCLVFSCIMFILVFFKGTWFTQLFSNEQPVIEAAAEVLKVYAFDTFLTSILFSFIGYFNGCGKTFLSLAQGFLGVVVRLPLAFAFASMPGAGLFSIGIAVPISSACQIIFLIICYLITNKKLKALYDEKENSCSEPEVLAGKQ